MTQVRIATRRSQLALWQAEHVAERLRAAHPGLQVEIVGLTTQGDRVLDAPLAKIGGKGLFVKELEVALLEGRADIAVHSVKDVPMELPAGLALPVFLEREDPFDAFVSNHHAALDALPQGAVVGSSSLRRQAQLLAHRPDLVMRDLRGNVNTRLAKLDAGEYDAIILACAGLIRLGFGERIRERLNPDISLPAVGQGVVAIECRSDDPETLALLAPLGHVESALRVAAERAFNRRLEGGCQVPLAAHATLDGVALTLDALVAATDGTRVLRACETHELTAAGAALDPDKATTRAEALGVLLAERLLAQGAGPLLEAAKQAGDQRTATVSALADRGVLVTRPREQAGELAALLTAQGARVLAFPALEIRDPANDAPLNDALTRLAQADIAVFISVNAVQRVFNRLGSLEIEWPATLAIAAIGGRTAKELKGLGHPANILPPRRFDSEALLDLPELAADAVAGKTVLLFRGDGGREHLADELSRRGARVEAIESYRRAKPDMDASDLMRSWSRNEIDVILVASVETWHNLYEMVGKLGRMWLKKTPVVAGSERIAEAIRSSGHAGTIAVAEDPSDAAMTAAAAHFLAERPDA